ncbi:TonB-dependent receptor [Tamlana flava]|uniref:TonB-dependent receptor n=1 Tax=Tamlana flava TaxID=3158572 RepID=UPI00351B1F9C
MGKEIKKAFIFFSLLFFVQLGVNAQDKDGQELLSRVLNILQEQYNIQFNYAEDTVENILLVPPAKSLSLSEALTYLEAETGLSYSMMSEGVILVQLKKIELQFCGYVKDRDNLQPLLAATVQSGNNSIITDDNGFFQIKIESPLEPITIRFLGYRPIDISPNQMSKTGCDDIFLVPYFQSLSEVLISNYITSGINKLSRGSYEIDFSNFDILPGVIDNDVLQSVQAFPGVQSINETVSNINIRGGTHDQNLILWDGIKMYQSGHFFGLISMYNPQITQTVSLVKNGSDASYTDGVSGTIAMKTEQEINTRFKGTLGINLTDVNAFVDAPLGNKSSIQIAARKSINDFVETPTYTAFFDRIAQNTEVANNATTITNTGKKFDFYDTSLRWIYKISDKDELRLNFINVSNQLQFDENAVVNQEEETRESSLKQNSIAGALHYNRFWNNRLQTTFEVFETDYKLRAINANILDSQRFLQENIVSETSAKIKADYNLFENLQLLVGYHVVETEITNLDDVDVPLFRNLVSEVVRTHAIFSQVGYRSSNRNTNINFGVRYNYSDKFKKSIWEPRLSFSQRIFRHLTLDVLGEFKNQNASQVINLQNDFLGIEKRRWQMSNNSTIPIIRSRQISSGLSYSHKGWLINFEGYYKQVKGITTQSQGFQNQYEFERQSGNYDVKGLDLLVRKHIDGFNTWLSYSYMGNRYLFESLEPDYFPSNYNISHTATIGATYTWSNLKISTGLNWHSGKPTTRPIFGNEIVDGDINYEPTNNSNLEDYLRLDMSALYNFNLGKASTGYFGVSIWNVLDRENQVNNYYRLDNESVDEIVQRSLGFTPNAVLRLTFQ